MRKFHIEIIITGTLELDDEVINRVDDEWRESLYDLKTPEEIASHIAFNLEQGRLFSTLDGWADLDNRKAEFRRTNTDVEAEEITK